MGPSGVRCRVHRSNLTPNLHCGVEIAASRSERDVQNGAISFLRSLEEFSVELDFIASSICPSMVTVFYGKCILPPSPQEPRLGAIVDGLIQDCSLETVA